MERKKWNNPKVIRLFTKGVSGKPSPYDARAFIILCHRKFVSHSHSPQGPPA